MNGNLKKVVVNKGKLPIHDGRRELFLDINSIVYCKACGNYTDIYMVEDAVRGVRIQMGQLDRLIGENRKMLDQPLERIGRSLILNLDCVRDVNVRKKLVVMHACSGRDIDVRVKKADAVHLIARMKRKHTESLDGDVSDNRSVVRKKSGAVPMFTGRCGSPRKWSDDEVKWCVSLHEEGFSYSDIAVSLGRTKGSVQIKMNSILKKTNAYNDEHVEEKFMINAKFADDVIGSFKGRHCRRILDLYCGYNGFWKQYADSKTNTQIELITNDVNRDISADYNEDAERLIHKLYYEGNTYDIVDIDPFGSPYECIELGVKMARRGLCVTFRDLRMKQFNRLDFVRDRYDVGSLDDFSVETLIDYVMKVGRRNKKLLEVYYYSVWNKVARVWFRVYESNAYEIAGLV